MTATRTGAVMPWLSPARLARIVVAITIAVLLVRTVLHINVAHALFDREDWIGAYGVNPEDGMATGYLAWTMERAGAHLPAERLARLALQRTSLSASAVAVLAQRAADRDPATAERLRALASRQGWRDAMLQTELAGQALARSDAKAAALHIDALGRIQTMDATTRALIDRMAETPATRTAMAARLALDPMWRYQYLLRIEEPLGNLGARAALLGALRGTAVPPRPIEVSGVLGLIARSGGYAAAYAAWLRIHGPPPPGGVNDAEFRAIRADQADATPFEWLLGSTPGVSASIGDDGTGLRVSTDGSTIGRAATQVIRLAPGRHQLTATGEFGSPTTGTAFRWNLYCTAQQPEPFPLRPLDGQATGAARFSFMIPADGSCPVQLLTLETQLGDGLGEQRARFTRVQIQ